MKKQVTASLNKNYKKGVFSLKNQDKGVVKKITSIALAAALGFSMMIPVFADTTPVYSQGTDATHPAEASITKVFKMPIYTDTPASTFTFTFTKVGMVESTDEITHKDTIDTSTKDGMPAINSVSVDFGAGVDPANSTNIPASGTFFDADTKSVVKETANFLNGKTSADWVNGEGIYRYTVSETGSGITAPGSSTTPPTEWTTYSGAEYEIDIWVEKDVDDNLYVKYVCAKTVADYIDEYYEGDPGGSKVDPTPGGSNSTPGNSITDGFSQVIFTNKYWKTTGGGEDDHSKSALDISKTVTGNGADRNKYFFFDIKVTQPSLIPEAPGTEIYKAYIMAGNTIVNSTDNYAGYKTDSKGKDYIEFTSGQTVTVKLKDGEKLAFADLHVGANVEVEEAAVATYVPKYERSFPEDAVSTADNDNTLWGFPRDPGDTGKHYTIDGTNANTVKFTNTRTGVTPTGIEVNDLPYFVMIGVALAGLLVFIAFKARRRSMFEE